MPEIVFIVEEFDKNGEILTLSEKFYHNNFPDLDLKKYLGWAKNSYKENTGRRIKYQTYASIENFNPNIKYFYFLPIAKWTGDFYNFLYLMSKEKVQRLVNNNVSFLFAYDMEHLPPLDISLFVKNLEWLFSMIYDYLHPAEQNMKWHFLSASEIKSDLKEFLKFHFNDRFRFHYSPMILMSSIKSLPQSVTFGSNAGITLKMASQCHLDYLNSPKEKQFLNLNMYPRFHRDTFIHGLRSLNLMSEGFVSRNQARFPAYDLLTRYQSEYANRVRADMLTPLEVTNLDVQNITDNLKVGYDSYPMEFMKASCYDIVSETGSQYEIDDVLDLTIISEKTAKSLAFGRPFMINGGPDCLTLLKKLGFETYDCLFDESYDQINDLLDRHECIMKNIMSYRNRIDQLWDKIKSHNDIMLRNQDRFFNFNAEDYLVKELL